MRRMSRLNVVACLLGAAVLAPDASYAQNPPPPDHPSVNRQPGIDYAIFALAAKWAPHRLALAGQTDTDRARFAPPTTAK